jgi:hypothetical protein
MLRPYLMCIYLVFPNMSYYLTLEKRHEGASHSDRSIQLTDSDFFVTYLWQLLRVLISSSKF